MAPVITQIRASASASARARTVSAAPRAHLKLTVLGTPRRPVWAPWRRPVYTRVAARVLTPELVVVTGVVAMCVFLLRAYDRSTPRILPAHRRR